MTWVDGSAGNLPKAKLACQFAEADKQIVDGAGDYVQLAGARECERA